MNQRLKKKTPPKQNNKNNNNKKKVETSKQTKSICTIDKIHKTKTWFFERINKAYKLAIILKKKEGTNTTRNVEEGQAKRLSGFPPAFGSGHDPRDPGSSPTSGSLRGACFTLCLCLS